MRKLPRRPNSWMLFKSLEPRNLRSLKKARRIHYLLNKFTHLEKGTMVPRMFQRKHKKVTYPLGSQFLTSISVVFACLSSVTNTIVSQASWTCSGCSSHSSSIMRQRSFSQLLGTSHCSVGNSCSSMVATSQSSKIPICSKKSVHTSSGTWWIPWSSRLCCSSLSCFFGCNLESTTRCSSKLEGIPC